SENSSHRRLTASTHTVQVANCFDKGNQCKGWGGKLGWQALFATNAEGLFSLAAPLPLLNGAWQPIFG
ncbi:MAG: hypothetical protein LHW48_09165, partial [Candidatus Cloacimonetes bacterium]|nr:hypothetical protein [Candidatus Cloacimonadota bacterium]